MGLTRFLLALVAAACLWGPAEAKDFYVSPQGRADAACASASPCTIEAAQQRARRAARNQREDIRILFLDGTYARTRPIELVESARVSDSGRNGHKIIWQAAPGARPVISGGVAVTGWRLHDPARNIWAAPAPSAAAYRTLYVNGARAERARSRDRLEGLKITKTGYRFAEQGDISGFRNLTDIELVRMWQWQISRCPVESATREEIRVARGCFENSQRVDVGIYIENAYELLARPGQWVLDRTGAVAGGGPTVFYIPRAGEKPETLSAVLGSTERLLTLRGDGERALLRNVTIKGLAFEHAGWFLDQSLAAKVGGYASLQAGLFLLTRHDLDNTSIVAPDPGIGFYNPENFTWLDYVPAAVSVEFARAVALEGNRFAHLGATGLALIRGVQGARVEGNLFTDISGSGVQVGGVAVEDHHPCGDVAACASPRITRDVRVANNVIDGAAAEFFDTLGVFVGHVRETVVEHNVLRNLSYSAISVGYGWGWIDAGGHSGFKHPTINAANHIRYNDISRHQTRMADGGAVYTLGAQPGSTIIGNYVHDVRRVYVGGIYLDEGTSGYTVTGNVVADATFFGQTNCGALSNNYDNRFSGNYSHNGAFYNTCQPGKNGFGAKTGLNTIENPILYFPGKPPAAVQAIIDKAGLEPAYRGLLGAAGAP